MVSLPIVDRAGREVGKYDIDPSELAPRINRQLLHDVVVMYQASARQGTFRTKKRGEVAGTKQKMYRQKGTGRARAGDQRSGTRRGGGHIHAKRPRDFSYRLPKKAVRAALRMALASKLQDNKVVVIDDLAFSVPKTKEMATILGALGLTGRTLVATASHDTNVYKSGRNIAGVTILAASDLNALEVLMPERILVTKAALDAIRSKAKPSGAAAGAA